MAKITLRDYLVGVEELIDEGKNDEALSHCRHILKSYPKNIDAYRLMGKALLEEKRYDDAKNLFQRVLSSVPDNFIAHVGMSIIHENQAGNDAAIWHMERAFESQPSNRAVQDELRRLYGEREGFAPPKVRLTRGALARMYSHGGLYNQAISELRNALKEDENRPDLQVLLAEMYYSTQQSSEAMQICSEVLEALPYCLYANHLMARILIEDGQAHESQIYTQRLSELDPYAVDVERLEDRNETPAERAMLEHLVPGTGDLKAEDVPQSWTGAFESRLEDPPEYVKEELPDWLSLQPSEVAQEQTEPDEIDEVISDSELKSLQELAPERNEEAESKPQLSDTQPLSPSTDKTQIVPEWLKELRPGEVSGETNEEPLSEPVLPEISEPTNELEGDQEKLAASESIDEGNDEYGLAWLEKLASDREDTVTDDFSGIIEDDIEDTGSEAKELIAEEEDDALDWMDQFEAEIEETPEIGANEELIEEPHGEDLQTTSPSLEAIGDNSELGNINALDEVEALYETNETPDWLKELAEEVDQSTKPTGGLSTKALENPPDWLEELKANNTDEIAAADNPEDDPDVVSPQELIYEETEEIEIERLDWLDNLKQPDAGEEMELPDNPEENDPEASAWVPESMLGETEEAAPETEAPETNGPDIHSSANETANHPIENEDSVEMAELQSTPAIAFMPNSKPADGELLEQARQALNYDNLEDAARHYKQLVKKGKQMDNVVADLQAAVSRHPKELGLWQALGDAYMRTDRLRDALDSYTKAEELL
ncbi:MAG: tetratricopeptide repeat protein [Chloroflexi bacterium]|nr:tetratricopeptide repeat protein [Chloroflexota bacterium]